MKKSGERSGMIQSGEMDRREFMRRMSTFGLAAGVSPWLFSNFAQAASPKRGGRFRMGLAGGSTSDSLDTATLNDAMNIIANYTCRNHLVEIDADGKPIPELAENWEASPDASKWIFNLRKHIEFHNGKSLDAEDVIFSFNHHRGKESKSGAKGIIDQVLDIQSDGKHTVIFTLKTGNADFPFVVNDYHLTIVPAGTSGKDWEEGVGTGGYILRQWEPGVRASYTRNPNYFKKDRAFFDEIELIQVQDVTARTNALKTNQIDFMNRADLKTVHLFKKASNLQIIQTQGGHHYTLPMHTNVKPFDDNNLRLALKYAVNRENMLKTVLRGYGSLGNDHPIASYMPYYNDTLPQRQYDPDKAKFYLKKAGLEHHTFELHASKYYNFLDIAVLFKEHAAKAGININIINQPTDGYWNNIWLNKPFCLAFWIARPTPDMMFSVAYSGDAKWNDSHFQHARFDELVKKARSEMDETKRANMYNECQKILHDEGGVIIPLFKDYVEAAGNKVRFGNIAGNWECDGYRAPERWWFED